MFSWRRKEESDAQDPPVENKPVIDLAHLRDQDVAVVFKHSPSCAISWSAETQVNKFITSHPSVPVYTVLVRKERELSQQIAAFTGVRHESPQVIVLRRGVPVANASHQDVTANFLTRAVAAKSDLA